jgi:hypothetical protein
MKREEAINLVTQVCVMYKGTLQEHSALQEALKVINTLVEAPKEEDAAKS